MFELERLVQNQQTPSPRAHENQFLRPHLRRSRNPKRERGKSGSPSLTLRVAIFISPPSRCPLPRSGGEGTGNGSPCAFPRSGGEGIDEHAWLVQSKRTNKTTLRRGALLVEALVAATILMVAVSLLSRAHNGLSQLWTETRRYQLATDELCNQMERLLVDAQSQQIGSLEPLQVTPEIAEVLPGAVLEGTWVSDSLGRRLVLTINWQRRGAADPLQLVGWLSSSSENAQQPTQEQQP